MATVSLIDAGGNVMDTVSITVRNNSHPTVAGDIADHIFVVGGPAREIALSGYFADPDSGDSLTYSASSTAVGVARASVSGGTLTIEPVAEGTATVAVTAYDRPSGSVARRSVFQTLTVTVMPVRAPRRSGDDLVVTSDSGGTACPTVDGDIAEPDAVRRWSHKFQDGP